MLNKSITFVLLLGLTTLSSASLLKITPANSIEQSIDDLANMDTLFISAGVYNEKIIVDVPLTILGEEGTIIDGGYEDWVILAKVSNVTIEGLTVRGSGSNLSHDHAGIFITADSVTIKNCYILESLHGIYVKAGNNTKLLGNKIEGRLDLIESDRGNGIHLWNSKNNELSNNEIFNARDGVYFSFADSTVMTGNHIHHVRYGLHYMYSNHNKFLDNYFTDNVAGAALMYSHDILFRRNVFAKCRGFRAYGILFQSMDSTVAEYNLVLDNSRGIFLNNSSKNILIGNDIVDNDLAIQLNGGCEENEFLQNNFINNLSDLILDVSDYNTVWEDEKGGNYWSSYAGYDLDGDGIGDVAHNIQRVFQVMETRVPEVRFYLLSPAAEILEIAERTLPILTQDNARDTQPQIRNIDQPDVPWNRIRENQNKADISYIFIYGLLAALPLVLFVRLGRKIGGQKK